MKSLFYYIFLISFSLLYFCDNLYACQNTDKFWDAYRAQLEHQVLANQWFDAARNGNLQKLRALIGTVDVNIQTAERGETALMIMAPVKRYEYELTILLNAENIDINATDKAGNTALIHAMSGHEAECNVKLLLQNPDIDINIQNQNGCDALKSAVFNRKENMVKLLLDRPEININAQDNNGATALMGAVDWDDENIVKLLLASPKLDINAQDKDGHTALMRCVLKHFTLYYLTIAVMKLILQDPRVNVNIQDKNGWTALMHAVHNHNLMLEDHNRNILKSLLDAPDTDLNIGDKDGNTVLINIAKNFSKYDQAKKDILNLILAARAKATAPGQIASELVQHRAINVNAQNNNGDTAFIIAVRGGSNFEYIIKILLEIPEIDANIQNKNFDTAFGIAYSYASAHYDKDIYTLLFESPKVNINIPKINKINIADWNMSLAKKVREKINELTEQAFAAIIERDIKTLKTIICKIGADITNSEGNTLLDKAFALNCSEIVVFLLQNSRDPRELLSRFPFEFINPTSDLFKFFVALAYGHEAVTILPESSKKDGSDKSKSLHLCAKCQKPSIERCGTCKQVYYCSPECQKADWKKHKLNCNA